MKGLMTDVQWKQRAVKAKSMVEGQLLYGCDGLVLRCWRVVCLYRGLTHHAFSALHFRVAAGAACMQFNESHAQGEAGRALAVF
jgi:hypothetical protein